MIAASASPSHGRSSEAERLPDTQDGAGSIPADRTTRRFNAGTIELLGRFGFSVGAGGLLICDREPAANCYIHHSQMPVAMVAMTLHCSDLATYRFPRTRLVDVVALRPSMDYAEAAALADLCGVTDVPTELRRLQSAGLSVPRRPFNAQLWHVIDTYGLGALFERDPQFETGIDVRPRGIVWRTSEVDKPAMAEWRRAYKALYEPQQMMAATIIWLYRGGPDKTWLTRLPCSWPAPYAIIALGLAGMAPDWAKLVALYPGW